MSFEKPRDLIWAVRVGDLETVRMLVEGGADVNAPLKGRPPLHVAADFGHNQVIEYLLSRGARLNEKDAHGMTPLLSAIYENHPQTVKLLLDKGADTNLKSPDGRHYIECAESGEIRQILETVK